jgi:serine/threonine protein kinase
MIGQFTHEIKLHSCLDSPNIVKFYGFFEQHKHIYLAMEYMNGGTLFEYLNKIKKIPLKEAVQFLTDVIDAVNYMHQRSIVHRDIKPENIVLSS